MARYEDAADRIAYVLFGGAYRATPKTLTVRDGIVFSYDMAIVRPTPLGYAVAMRGPTATTRRHLTAARMALTTASYTELGSDRVRTMFVKEGIC